MYGFYQGRTRGEHGVRNDQDTVLQIGAGQVFQTDLKGTVFLVFAVGGNKGIIRAVKKMKQPIVQGQTGTQDGGQDGLLF